MHSETDEKDIEEQPERVEGDAVDEAETVDPAETVVMSEDSFSDPDISMEVNVEKLVAELEGAGDDEDEAHRKAEIRHRLEELAEEGSLEDTYAIDLNED